MGHLIVLSLMFSFYLLSDSGGDPSVLCHSHSPHQHPEGAISLQGRDGRCCARHCGLETAGLRHQSQDAGKQTSDCLFVPQRCSLNFPQTSCPVSFNCRVVKCANRKSSPQQHNSYERFLPHPQRLRLETRINSTESASCHFM